MRVRTVAMLAVALPTVVGAAPVPTDAEAVKIRQLYGTPVDPSKDCRFTLSGEKLVIGVQAAGHTFASLGTSGAVVGPAPRVTRVIEGDFRATVRVRTARPHNPDPTGDPKLFQAGLFVAAEQGFVFNCRAVVIAKGTANYSAESGQGIKVGPLKWRELSGDTYASEGVLLRVTRTGNKMAHAVSADGQEWSDFSTAALEVNYPPKVTLGLFAANPSGQPFAAEFDQFTVTPLPAAGGKK